MVRHEIGTIAKLVSSIYLIYLSVSMLIIRSLLMPSARFGYMLPELDLISVPETVLGKKEKDMFSAPLVMFTRKKPSGKEMPSNGMKGSKFVC